LQEALGMLTHRGNLTDHRFNSLHVDRREERRKEGCAFSSAPESALR
jgi:hypothetical protein